MILRKYSKKDIRVAVTGQLALLRDKKTGQTIWLGDKRLVKTSRKTIDLLTI